MESTSNITPRFDLELAKTLLKRGKCSSEVVAAAERLGDHQLKRSIERYIESTHESRSLGNILRRELGLGSVRYPFTTRSEARASCAWRPVAPRLRCPSLAAQRRSNPPAGRCLRRIAACSDCCTSLLRNLDLLPWSVILTVTASAPFAQRPHHTTSSAAFASPISNMRVPESAVPSGVGAGLLLSHVSCANVNPVERCDMKSNAVFCCLPDPGWRCALLAGPASRRRRRRLGADMCIARPGEMRGSGVDNTAGAKARRRRGGSSREGAEVSVLPGSVSALRCHTAHRHDGHARPRVRTPSLFHDCPHLIPFWKRVCSSAGAAGIVSVWH